MVKNILFIWFLWGTLTTYAQSYIGFTSDNYSGIHGVISNPAQIADTPYRADINLAGFSSLAGNDYYKVRLSDVFKSGYDFSEDATKSSNPNNNVFGNIDVLGPSFLFNIGNQSALALFTRGRVMFNISEINGQTFENVTNEFEEDIDYRIDEGDFYANAQAWSEIGISYATVLHETDMHFIKGGISLKYLQGYANGYALGNEITVDYDADGITLPSNETTGSITTTGQVTYGYTSNFEDYEFQKMGSGFGIDIGAVYEWRSAQATDYKLKLGISVTDIGSITYNDGIEEKYDITNSIRQEDLDDLDGLQEKLDNLYTQIGMNNGIKATLPTALHLNADYNLSQKVFLNLNADYVLAAKSKVNATRSLNMVSLTPRYESKWFSFYSPLSLMQHAGFQWGFGLRAGPLYLGSGSILSSLARNEIQSTDVYAGLKIPLFRTKTKTTSNDSDGDGVLNVMDGCPKIPGPASNDGCPVN